MTTARSARGIARLILATRAVDQAFRRFDRLRSRAVVRWTSSDVLDAFTTLAYERDKVYSPDSDVFRASLFAWETLAIDRHFPPAPGKVLVGGAGGGREPFALAERGYEVVAFEPAPELAAAMAARTDGRRVRAFRAAYEDLPALHPASPGGPATDVHREGPFAAAVFGWGSYSHLLTRSARLSALAAFARVTRGPILVSFLAMDDVEANRFSVFVGAYRTVSEAEVARLAQAAGLSVVALEVDASTSPWPHAVLRSAGAQ